MRYYSFSFRGAQLVCRREPLPRHHAARPRPRRRRRRRGAPGGGGDPAGLRGGPPQAGARGDGLRRHQAPQGQVRWGACRRAPSPYMRPRLLLSAPHPGRLVAARRSAQEERERRHAPGGVHAGAAEQAQGAAAEEGAEADGEEVRRGLARWMGAAAAGAASPRRVCAAAPLNNSGESSVLSRLELTAATRGALPPFCGRSWWPRGPPVRGGGSGGGPAAAASSPASGGDTAGPRPVAPARDRTADLSTGRRSKRLLGGRAAHS